METEQIGVQKAQIALRTTSSDYYRRIELFRPVGHRIQRPDYRRLGPVSLHDGTEKRHIETVRRRTELLHEVLITGSLRGGDDRNALGYFRNTELTIQVEHTILPELGDGLHALPGQVTERIERVDIHYSQRQTVQFVVGHRHMEQHLHPDSQLLPRRPAEIRGEHTVLSGPDDGLHLRLRHAVAAALLHQLQVTVPGTGIHLQFAYFGGYPHRRGESAAKRLPDTLLQLRQRHIRIDRHINYPFF